MGSVQVPQFPITVCAAAVCASDMNCLQGLNAREFYHEAQRGGDNEHRPANALRQRCGQALNIIAFGNRTAGAVFAPGGNYYSDKPRLPSPRRPSATVARCTPMSRPYRESRLELPFFKSCAPRLGACMDLAVWVHENAKAKAVVPVESSLESVC